MRWIRGCVTTAWGVQKRSNMKAHTEVVTVAGSFSKVVHKGRTFARADAQGNGSWRLTVCPRFDESRIVWSPEEACTFIAIQALAAALS